MKKFLVAPIQLLGKLEEFTAVRNIHIGLYITKFSINGSLFNGSL